MARPSGLGRGLGALIPQDVSTGTSSKFRDVPLGRIRPNPYQPRKEFDEEALASLVDSIRVIGILQPVLLREAAGGDYELIAGERRCRAARRAGLQVVPALVQSVSDVSSLEQALVENLHRADLNVLEEAAAFKQLIEDFHLTHDEVARRVGKSRAAVSNALRLFQLPTAVQGLLRERRLSFGHARALLGTPDRELQESLAQTAVELGLSVRALEGAVRESLRALGGPDEAEAEDSLVSGEGGLSPVPPGAAGVGEGDRSPAGVLEHGGGDPLATPLSGDVSGQRSETAAALPPLSHSLRPPGILELENLLSNHLDTRVKVEMGARHGRVVVDFATLEDLERIYRLMVGDR